MYVHRMFKELFSMNLMFYCEKVNAKHLTVKIWRLKFEISKFEVTCGAEPRRCIKCTLIWWNSLPFVRCVLWYYDWNRFPTLIYSTDLPIAHHPQSCPRMQDAAAEKYGIYAFEQSWCAYHPYSCLCEYIIYSKMPRWINHIHRFVDIGQKWNILSVWCLHPSHEYVVVTILYASKNWSWIHHWCTLLYMLSPPSCPGCWAAVGDR